jgi:hypothetical protein
VVHSKSGLPINGFAFLRSVVTGQVELDLGLDLNLNSNNNTQAPEQITTGSYIYRAIATNLEILSE